MSADDRRGRTIPHYEKFVFMNLATCCCALGFALGVIYGAKKGRRG